MTDEPDLNDEIERINDQLETVFHRLEDLSAAIEPAAANRRSELVERTDTGVSITTELKRGTGTRDQDTHKIKAKGHTVADALTKLDQTIDGLEDRDHFQASREYQPEVEEADE